MLFFVLCSGISVRIANTVKAMRVRENKLNRVWVRTDGWTSGFLLSASPTNYITL